MFLVSVARINSTVYFAICQKGNMRNAFVNTLYLHSISPFHTAFNQGLMNIFLLNQQK